MVWWFFRRFGSLLMRNLGSLAIVLYIFGILIRSRLPLHKFIMPAWITFIGLPWNPCCFNHNFLFKGWKLGIKFGQVYPCNSVIIHNLKSEDVWTFKREMIIDMLQSNVRLIHHDSKNIRSIRIIFIFWYMIVNKSHLFLGHSDLKCVNSKFNQYPTLINKIWIR